MFPLPVPTVPLRVFWRPSAAALALLVTAACEPDPGSNGSAPARAAPPSQNAQPEAQRQSRQDFFRGPRGGSAR
jgi:hypothetical protein